MDLINAISVPFAAIRFPLGWVYRSSSVCPFSPQAKGTQGTAPPRGCEELLSLLKAAEDSRSVRSVVPTADPAAFLAGNTQGQRKVWGDVETLQGHSLGGSDSVVTLYHPPWHGSLQAVLQQAHVAGVQAAESPQEGGRFKLLEEALSLGKAYGVAVDWEVRINFVLGILTVSSTKPAEVRMYATLCSSSPRGCFMLRPYVQF